VIGALEPLEVTSFFVIIVKIKEVVKKPFYTNEITKAREFIPGLRVYGYCYGTSSDRTIQFTG